MSDSPPGQPPPPLDLLNLQLSGGSGLPLYRQLKEALLTRIRGGSWPSGAALPAEREFQERLGIARATVRQAMLELEREGWLVRQRGRGTFVNTAQRPKVGQPLNRLVGFSENMRAQGLTPSSRLISARLETPAAGVAAALNLTPGSVVAVLTRLRLADGEPLMLERSHLDYALVPGLLEHDLSASLYALLVQTYRLELSGGEERLEALVPDKEVRALLGLKPSAAVLYTQRHVWSAQLGAGQLGAGQLGAGQERPVEYTQRYARADKCSFWVSLSGDNARLTLKESASSPAAAALPFPPGAN